MVLVIVPFGAESALAVPSHGDAFRRGWVIDRLVHDAEVVNLTSTDCSATADRRGDGLAVGVPVTPSRAGAGALCADVGGVGELGAILQSQLLVDVANVGLDRCEGDEEGVGDLLVGVAFHDQRGPRDFRRG